MTHPERQAILIAGMHRSGTSALARVLNLLGADTGSGLLPAVHGDNESGYWELREVVALNNECLEHFGLSWQESHPMPEAWLDDPWLDRWSQRVTALIDCKFPDTALFTIKDPRLSRLLPVWRRVLGHAGIRPLVIIMLRHPLEVTASLLRRADNTLTTTDAHRLWIRYTADAATASRNCPNSWVRYDSVLGSWRKELRRIATDLGINWPVGMDSAALEIQSFLDPQLQHQRAAQQIVDLDNDAMEHSCALYSQLVQCLDKNQSVEAAIDQACRCLVMEVDRSPVRQAAPQQVEQGMPTGPAGNLDIWTPSELLRHRSQLYFRSAADSYNSCHSVAVEAQINSDALNAPFILPEEAKTDFIRFDPSDLGGIYRLLGVRVNNMDIAPGLGRVTAVQERELATTGEEWVRFAAVGGDPWVEIDLRNLPAGSGTAKTIEVRFQRETVTNMLQNHLKQQERELTAQRELQAIELDRIRKQVDAVSQQAEATSSAAFATYLAQQTNRSVMRRDRGLPLEIAGHSHVHLLAQHPGFESRVWSLTGRDPRFNLRFPRQKGALPAGWYVLSTVLRPLTGELLHPLLYVDYGEGFKESDAIPLALADNVEKHRLLVNFTQPIQALRLDPSNTNEPCNFLFGMPTLRRTSRSETLLRLTVPAVKRMRTQGATWPRVAQEMWRSIWQGFGKAIDILHTNSQVATDSYAGISYAKWIAENDALDDHDKRLIQTKIAAMGRLPKFSILLPVFNTPEPWLRLCIESVIRQLYPNWELCIADDGSTEPHVREVITEYMSGDSRIKACWRESNGHISAASNSALTLATGDYVALLDHDDELSEYALYSVAEELQTSPKAHLIYSDEDKIDDHGTRFDPYFKPDWNPELFLSQNMICHLCVFAHQDITAVGGFREGYEGSQDHDLALRISERLEPEQIAHIPRVLYHWRAIAGSTAINADQKSYAHGAAQRAIEDHLHRTGQDAEVSPTSEGYLRVRYRVPEPAPLVSLIIPTRDRVDLLKVCVGSILKLTDYPNLEVIIVDNQSSDPETLEWMRRMSDADPRVRILRHDKPFNFSRINNEAVQEAKGEFVGLINNDIEVTHSDWLRELVSHAARKGTGAVGAKLYYPDGSIQHAGVILGFGGVAGHAYCGKPHSYPGQMNRANLVQNMSAVTAACLLVKTHIYREVGGMNEDLVIAFNDIDFCLRVTQAGYRNVWTPFAELTHHESASRGYEDTIEKQRRFTRETELMKQVWGDKLMHDPAYNCSLSLIKEPFTLGAAPSRL